MLILIVPFLYRLLWFGSEKLNASVVIGFQKLRYMYVESSPDKNKNNNLNINNLAFGFSIQRIPSIAHI